VKKSFLIITILTLAISCQGPRVIQPVQSSPPPPPSPAFYYAMTTTNLRSCPTYGKECSDVAQVFIGDKMELIQKNDSGWSQVKIGRAGVAGWMPSNLLSLKPVAAVFSISGASVYSRECADYNCRGIELLRRGDQVEKIDQDERGWWRVVALKSRRTGWIPVSAVTPQLGPIYKYVSVRGLALRSGPGTSFRAISTLDLNDQVKILTMGSSGWAQVQDVRRKITGWCATGYLKSAPVSSSRQLHRKPAKRRASPRKEILETDEAPKVEPKVPLKEETPEVQPTAM
jgi:uncharacterized protein YgiM (DUF1202 family)